MTSRRWLRIIPVALVMYTISYMDRTNLIMTLTPTISTMMQDLGMKDAAKGWATGIFFFGYVLLQIPGGYLATRWSPRKVISLSLIGWGVSAVACGLVRTLAGFEVARACLGAAESAVFPSMLVLLANWFPRTERARANAYWNLCQPIAVVVTALATGALLQKYSWRTALVLEGVLPFVWLPIWWLFIRDCPAKAKWLPADERDYLETTLRDEAAEIQNRTIRPGSPSRWSAFFQPMVLILIAINFLHNSLAYGCMAFFTGTFEGQHYNAMQNGWLFALPFAITAILMVLVSHHSDKTNERRKHVAITYIISGLALMASVSCRDSFGWSYAFLCLSLPGPSVALSPFWVIPSEILPPASRGAVMGMINACGNLGGIAGPSVTGWLKQQTHSLAVPFNILAIGILIAAALTFLLPKTKPRLPQFPGNSI